MESYLVDEALLSEAADSLIKERYPNESPENYAELKKKIMDGLDHQIIKAIIGSITEEQGAELSQILDGDDSDPDKFDAFFEKYGIDLEEVVKKAILEFKSQFEKGGKNA